MTACRVETTLLSELAVIILNSWNEQAALYTDTEEIFSLLYVTCVLIQMKCRHVIQVLVLFLQDNWTKIK